MVVTASYGYGITSDVIGYIVTPRSDRRYYRGTITYAEGRITKAASTPVTVKKVLVSIEATTNPAKMAYTTWRNSSLMEWL